MALGKTFISILLLLSLTTQSIAYVTMNASCSGMHDSSNMGHMDHSAHEINPDTATMSQMDPINMDHSAHGMSLDTATMSHMDCCDEDTCPMNSCPSAAVLFVTPSLNSHMAKKEKAFPALRANVLATHSQNLYRPPIFA